MDRWTQNTSLRTRQRIEGQTTVGLLSLWDAASKSALSDSFATGPSYRPFSSLSPMFTRHLLVCPALYQTGTQITRSGSQKAKKTHICHRVGPRGRLPLLWGWPPLHVCLEFDIWKRLLQAMKYERRGNQGGRRRWRCGVLDVQKAAAAPRSPWTSGWNTAKSELNLTSLVQCVSGYKEADTKLNALMFLSKNPAESIYKLFKDEYKNTATDINMLQPVKSKSDSSEVLLNLCFIFVMLLS